MFASAKSSRCFLISVVTVAACAPGSTEQAVTVEPEPAAVKTIVEVRADAEALIVEEAFRHGPRLMFSPCPEDPALECGQLSVPVDYARPRGARIELATVRAPATGARRRGAIFVNPGGPGGSGVDFVLLAQSLFAPLRADFDIVSFDPRGTNRSAPVDCEVALPPAPDAGATLPEQAAYWDEIGRRYANACADQFGALAIQVGTNNVARDIDVLRAALGERELNYLGFSYGTILGASYADQFPSRVRAMVLDANTPPGWFADNLLELDAEGSVGAEAALARLDRLCRDAADCPLRTAGVVATYDRIVARLDANPVPADGGVIIGLSLQSVVFGALYSEAFGWAAIPRFLARVDGGDLRGLPAFPLESGASVVISGTFAIACSDSTTRRGGLDTLPLQDAAYAITPRFGGANFGIAPALCSAWPQPGVNALDDLRTRRSVLLIGNDYDPATPMTWSRNMAAALGAKARLVRYQGGGHTIYGSGSTCIDTAVEQYFRELTVPEVGLTCPALPLAFAPSARAASGLVMSQVVQQVTAKSAPALPRRR